MYLIFILVHPHLFHGLFDKVVDSVAVPVHLAESSIDDTVKLVQIRPHEGLLYRQKLKQNVVVHIDNKIKVAGPPPESFHLLINLKSTVRDSESQQQEILHFSEKFNQSWIEIDVEEAFIKISDKKGQFKLRLAGSFYIAPPLLNLLVLVLLETRDYCCVHLQKSHHDIAGWHSNTSLRASPLVGQCVSCADDSEYR